MSDTSMFLVGLFVSFVLGGGLTLTVREFSKMGNKDQNDSYPRPRPW